MGLFQKLLHAGEGKKLKLLQSIVPEVTAFEPEMERRGDDELRALTGEFRSQLDQTGSREDRIALLDDLMPEAFALVREAGRRALGQRHFDVQIMGGAALHFGWVAEMKTGEGKTLVATLPLYLNALAGYGAHLVTVNDYLARRDAEWMGRIYRFLGMEVGTVLPQVHEPEAKRAAYAADITYGTNNEFGFDYLRDNMAGRKEDQAQGPPFFAIVDEVDSILVDEARTPLIISGRADDAQELYYQFARVTKGLQRDRDYEVDEAKRTVVPTEEGIGRVEESLGVENLYEHVNQNYVHQLQAALRAKELFKPDVDYVVQHGEVKVVDEFTGRILEGRRWSEGLHQAVEAKEGVKIKAENQTLATITLQNYFRMYEKLAGMTGTAETEESEFVQIYTLDVVVIPTNRPIMRDDGEDQIYRTKREKFNAVLDEIERVHKDQRPVLVGTTSVETSELISRMLKRKHIPHSVLNAKYHQKEAEIVSKAGLPGAVTIATNMAGRGTDIKLGTGVAAAGGLHIVGTERHEARRIDRQLRGRAGRQGDPGSSSFYLSLEDDLMRLFQSDRVATVMDKLGVEEGEVIEHRFMTKAIERAQKRVEEQNFGIRKHLLEYDNVMNKQREIIYKRRLDALEGETLFEECKSLVGDIAAATVEQHTTGSGSPYADDWDFATLRLEVRQRLGVDVDFERFAHEGKNPEELKELAIQAVLTRYDERERLVGPEIYRQFERFVTLSTIDSNWKDHLYNLDRLREGIGLRAYGQKDPLLEYKKEAFEAFADLTDRIDLQTAERLMKTEIRAHTPQPVRPSGVASHPVPAGVGAATSGGASARPGPPQRALRPVGPLLPPAPSGDSSLGKDVGRNDPCPCGSGKKYKKCHGRNA